MADLDHNGIDDDFELATYKSQAVNAKFVQQLSYGIGAAMVFGLVSVLGKTLADMASTAIAHAGATTIGTMVAAATGPLLGLAALGVLGVGLLYVSAKFLSENTLRDQELQAKQISVATRGKGVAITPIAPGKIQELPETAEAVAPEAAAILPIAASDVPQTVIGDRALAETITPRAVGKTPDKNESWAAQIAAQANDNDAQLSKAM